MRYKFLVKTNAISPAQEEAYNKWYDEVHVPQILDLPGFVSAERFVFGERQVAGTPAPAYKYLAIYDVETDDLEGSLAALRDRLGTPQMIISDAVDIGKSWAEIFVARGGGPSHAAQP